MRKISLTFPFLIALALAVWTACADRKEISLPSEQVHADSWMQASSADFHGAKIAEVGPISCRSCHGEDYRGGSSEVSCYTSDCHNGPSGHPVGYLSPVSANFHGNRVASQGPAACQPCHGEDYKGGTSGQSCYACHNGPSGHPAQGWLDMTSENFHGLAASLRTPTDCARCHGADFKGGTSGQSCRACHPSESGHPAAGFLDPANAKFHGTRYAQTGDAYCGGCHGQDLHGGYSTVSCYDCHDGPSGHPSEGWLDKTSPSFHGLEASTRGLPACAKCHGADFTGGTSGVSCKKCHTSQSGHPSSGWLVSTSPSFHGERLIQTGPAYCAGCHGANYRGGDAGVSCFTCHNGPSGHPAAGWLEKTSENFHGLAASKLGLSDCARCHGVDFKGGISGQSCSECHASQSGHPATGWLVPSDAKFHGARLAQTGPEYCAGCHGTDYRGGEAGVSCYTCHKGPSGHPATGWLTSSSPNFHGLATSSRGLSDCAVCHGADFNGGISGQSCKVCHASQSGHPSTGWMTVGNANFHGTHLAETGLAYCAGCHGDDFKGGDAGVSCYTCHDGPSGHPATGWLTSSSSDFHGLVASSRGLPACAVCHGQEFDGGISGQSCSTCHANESGHPSTGFFVKTDPNFHGTRLQQRGAGYCAGCHGADFTGGDSGKSCFVCHTEKDWL
ncbi:MAG: hypothetical protein V1794_13120 [Candidatus Glassbacteria bacterium]